MDCLSDKNLDEIIRRSRKNGSGYLTEAESKAVLKNYNIPVVPESIVLSTDEAVKEAHNMGFPVVLKGLGANLIHKTERGLVIIDNRSEDDVRESFCRIRKSSGDDWEGCLVQPMVQGKREFTAGLFRDPQFGPVVMFGLGGIFTEAIGDVAFRLTPVTRMDIVKMLEDLSCRKLLSNFRGEPAVDLEQVIQIIMGLSRLGAEYPEITEVDINPLIVMPDGHLTAVDALIVVVGGTKQKNITGDNKYALERVESIQQAIDAMVNPKSIAVIGAKRPNAGLLPGADIFNTIREFGFSGNLYPINPRADEIHGYKAYPDLFSLPEIPDLVIICVPAENVPKTLQECAASGSKKVHIFASGFKETNDVQGIRLQDEIEQIAHDGGLHVIGPNCMGLYVPKSKIVTWPEAFRQSGPIAFISQSGGHSRDFTKYAGSRFGMYFSKVISYGNALTLDCTDFLEYLLKDEQTKLILMYIEGVKDGQKFFKLVRQTNLRKPVVLFKAGLTDEGIKMAASHTGALAGSQKIWDAFFKQSGAIRVDSLEEMADTALVLLHLNKCSGRRVAVLGSGGGISVNAADTCSKAGLELPSFSAELIRQFQTFIPAAGNIIGNPLDAYKIFFDLELLGRALEILSNGMHADMFIIFLHLDWLFTDNRNSGEHIKKTANYIASEAKKRINGKPFVVAWRQYLDNPAAKKAASALEKILLNAGVPVYKSLNDAVSALSKMAEYHEFRNEYCQTHSSYTKNCK